MTGPLIENQTRFVEVSGKKTQLMRGGSGPPLVYLHSAGGETDWTDFHNRLARDFTVYAPAHPGFALSSGLDEIDDLQDMVWHYVDLLHLLQLRDVPIVGFSLGAWIGIELAILRPALVGRLVMIAAAGLHVEGAPMAELFIDDFDKIRRLLFYDPEGPAVEQAMPTSLDDPRILLWLRVREATARVGWNPYLHNPRLPRHLHRVGCPTLLIWGSDDRLIPCAHGQYYADHVAGSRLEILAECGHMVPFEKTDELARLTRGFLLP